MNVPTRECHHHQILLSDVLISPGVYGMRLVRAGVRVRVGAGSA